MTVECECRLRSEVLAQGRAQSDRLSRTVTNAAQAVGSGYSSCDLRKIMPVTELPTITEPKWTQEQAVAFEAARECLGDVIAICVANIADEEAKAEPDFVRLATLEVELAVLTKKRRELKLADAEAVAQVRAFYGPQVRSYRKQSQLAAA